MVQVSLTFLTYNRLGIVSRCFKSMLPTLASTQWCIFDNGSTDGTTQWLLKLKKHYPDIQLHLNASNVGVAGGRQYLLNMASGDHIAFLDSDVIALSDNWLMPLVEPLAQPHIGITGALGWYVTPEWDIRPAPEGASLAVDILSGYCQVFKREVLARGVGVDMDYQYISSEDDDFVNQIRAKGYEAWQIGSVALHHVFSGTWNVDGQRYHAGRALFKQKWEGRGIMHFEREIVHDG